MKRILCCLFCFSLLCSFIGCIQKKNSPDLFQGMYYALGEYEYGLRPYILLLPHKSEFDLGIGTAISTVRGGTYQIIDDNIISSTDSPIFRFEIKPPKAAERAVAVYLAGSAAAAYFIKSVIIVAYPRFY